MKHDEKKLYKLIEEWDFDIYEEPIMDFAKEYAEHMLQKLIQNVIKIHDESETRRGFEKRISKLINDQHE